jgi:osmotically-inducible protein OsmY
VQGSKVILRGMVRSYAEKVAAEETAWESPGVTDVENDIVVSPPV